MSIDTTSDKRRWLDLPPGVRFRPRDEPPEPLFGPPNVNYPGCDGRPMSDNTLQEQWIDRLKGGLETLFRDDPDVFVASNLMWYPVEEVNRRRLAPDAMVAFGRPKGYRTSYVQHLEAGIPPQVVFEILSPGNRRRVMEYKRKFYERHGVEEYYLFDPYQIKLDGWLRVGELFEPIAETSGWTSPRLGIRFELADDLTIFAPDGRPFLDFAEVARQRDDEIRRANKEQRRADKEQRRADKERRQRLESERQADEERRQRLESEQKAESERLKAERLAARLRALGLDPEE